MKSINKFANKCGVSNESANKSEGDTSNVEGNKRVASDDYNITVEDEAATITTQIGDNVTSEGMSIIVKMLSDINIGFSTTLNKSFKPNSYLEASQNPKWVEAMNLEMKALHRNNTYALVDLLPRRKAIGCKWICKIKYKSSGEVDRYKTRLMAKGYSQREGINYEDTFSPVVIMVTVICLIALSIKNKWIST
nr:putative reverse transcriptase, RNA-dependent DNA polymerase, Gag-polypeptide of LTR copia-type [Tanacetum cinerariifolium]